jgi:hypothetical protein
MTRSAVFNNIVTESGNRGIYIWDASEGGFYSSNGISHNLSFANPQPGELGSNPRFGNPRFVAPPAFAGAAADFRLSPGSPAIATGIQFPLPLPGIAATDLGAHPFGVPVWPAGL